MKKLKFKRAEKATGLSRVTYNNYNRPVYIHENEIIGDDNWIGTINYVEGNWKITFFGRKNDRKHVTFAKRSETMNEAKKLANYYYSSIVTGCSEIIRNKLNWEVLS